MQCNYTLDIEKPFSNLKPIKFIDRSPPGVCAWPPHCFLTNRQKVFAESRSTDLFFTECLVSWYAQNWDEKVEDHVLYYRSIRVRTNTPRRRFYTQPFIDLKATFQTQKVLHSHLIHCTITFTFMIRPNFCNKGYANACVYDISATKDMLMHARSISVNILHSSSEQL